MILISIAHAKRSRRISLSSAPTSAMFDGGVCPLDAGQAIVRGKLKSELDLSPGSGWQACALPKTPSLV